MYRVGFNVRWRSNDAESHLVIRELDDQTSEAARRHARRLLDQIWPSRIKQARVTSIQKYKAAWDNEATA